MLPLVALDTVFVTGAATWIDGSSSKAINNFFKSVVNAMS